MEHTVQRKIIILIVNSLNCKYPLEDYFLLQFKRHLESTWFLPSCFLNPNVEMEQVFPPIYYGFLIRLKTTWDKRLKSILISRSFTVFVPSGLTSISLSLNIITKTLKITQLGTAFVLKNVMVILSNLIIININTFNMTFQ